MVFAQLTLWIDRSIGTVPEFVATNADSARAVFGAIAGGLITAITLVLSMMLVAVQLASSQFSPRTLRDWLSDSVLKHTIGLALGATVFSLLALRSTRSSDVANEELVPDVSVAVAVFFAVLSLLAVVRAVDHITHSLQVGSIAKRLAQDTIRVIDATESVRVDQSPRDVPSAGSLEQVGVGDGSAPQIPHGAVAIEVETSGWVQQIEMTALLEQLPADSTGHVVVPLGGFVPAHAPVMWVSPAPDDVEACRLSLLSAFALGDSRTFQQDVAFGVMQLTDIAVRAMSPGINDPATAADIVVQLGDVMLALWAHPRDDAVIEEDGRRLVRRPTSDVARGTSPAGVRSDPPLRQGRSARAGHTRSHVVDDSRRVASARPPGARCTTRSHGRIGAGHGGPDIVVGRRVRRAGPPRCRLTLVTVGEVSPPDHRRSGPGSRRRWLLGPIAGRDGRDPCRHHRSLRAVQWSNVERGPGIRRDGHSP